MSTVSHEKQWRFPSWSNCMTENDNQQAFVVFPVSADRPWSDPHWESVGLDVDDGGKSHGDSLLEHHLTSLIP